jgi:hypothetical protein
MLPLVTAGKMRDWYAAAFGRRGRQENNRFWSPSKLLAAIPDFERVSTLMQFSNYEEFAAAERQLFNRVESDAVSLTRALKKIYYRAVALAGKRSIYILPNLASTFRRRPE